MSDLTPVSFKKGRASAPRLSAPYEPGRHSRRFWSLAEEAVLREHFPSGGRAACAPHLPGRSKASIYARANALGLHCGAIVRGPATPKPSDETIRARWAELKGRGAVLALAEELGVRRTWLSQRALNLGLTMPHRKEPAWSAAEDALMRIAPLHDPKRASRLFAEHGLRRLPTAIVVRAQRLALSRRATRGVFSGTSAARMLGVDSKTMTAWILAGDLKATRRDDKRLPQQGGSAFDIAPADLRRFVIDRLERIDIRKVDKFAFVSLIAGEPTAPAGVGDEECVA